MCEGSRIYDNGIYAFGPGEMNAVNERAFPVCLEEGEGAVGGVGGGLERGGGFDVGEGGVAVDLGLAGSEEVEIGTIEEEDFLGWHLLEVEVPGWADCGDVGEDEVVVNRCYLEDWRMG